jgi:HK97 family phage prohead protease
MKMRQAMNNQCEVRSIKELRIATADDGTRTITASIPYNSPSVDLGGFTEIIAPGAFASALEPDADVLCLRDHDSKLLMGRTKSHTMTLQDTKAGLVYTCTLPNTTSGNDLAESIARGDLDATSFGFTTTEDKWAADDEGNVIRTLVSVNLLECSPCSFAAYPAANVSIRSCPTEIRSKLTEQRDDPDADPKCQCDCDECLDGNCDGCSNLNCTDEVCNCSEQRNTEELNTNNEDDNRRLAIRVGFASLL